MEAALLEHLPAEVLVVEDEPDLRGLLDFNLGRAGFHVTVATNGGEALARARAKPPAVIVLDVNLPDVCGYDLCRTLRGHVALQGTAVLMLTARNAESERILGFEAGADDYVVKPFHVQELVLRVRALAQRTRQSRSTPTTVLEFGPIRVDADKHRVTVDRVPLELRPLEFKLLVALLAAAPHVVTRAEILQKVWRIDADTETRTVDATLRRLRERLGEHATMIETLPRVGYRLRARAT